MPYILLSEICVKKKKKKKLHHGIYIVSSDFCKAGVSEQCSRQPYFNNILLK
jgi:hypothetical protein